MTMRDRILDQVRSRQNSAGVAETIASSIRIILEFDGTPAPDAVATALKSKLRIDAVVQPLSGSHGEPAEQTDNALARFVAVTIPSVAAADLAPSPFEFAHAMADAAGALTAEPELGTDFYAEPEAESVEGFQESCWVPDSRDPSSAKPLWAVEKIKAVGAWQTTPAAGGKSRGAGISIFQPDTGVADHTELGESMLDLSRAYDFLLNKPGAADPLDYEGNPGHGTGTASVVAGRGVSGRMSGSAPAATLVPLRVIEKVVVFDHGRVAAAVEYARRKNADVITMSLGGAWSSSLRAAINRAIADGVIVLAAAGNCVDAVVWPARYEEVIAVAGSNLADKPWKGSCSGRAVDITAPAEFVPRANRSASNNGSPTDVRGGQGTSFAVALTAGVAALWLAHHGKAAIRASLQRGETIQSKFVSILRATAVAGTFDTTNYGAGVVDAAAVLSYPLTGRAEVAEAVADAAPQDDAVRSLENLLDEVARPAGEPRAGAAEHVVTSAPLSPRFAAELSHLALRKAQRGKRGTAETVGAHEQPSETLKIALGADATSLVGRLLS